MKNYKAFLFVLILFCQSVQAATVSPDSLATMVNLGDTFTIDIIGTGFPETQGGGFSLAFDPNILNVTNVSIDEAITWTFINDFGTIDNVAGTLSEVKVSDVSVTGDFIVATIEFYAAGSGISNLGLTEALGNPWGSNGNLINPTFIQSATVTVTAVPLVPSLFLFISGLLGLIKVSWTGGNTRKLHPVHRSLV